ncbi:hypothetical protein FRC17_008682 [Serendipita sp. 399]|nr:hypothetical protein FRC17_008682 [Serendipita sp. 399]
MSQEKELPPIPTDYPTDLPSQFSIGSSKTSPLVDLTELQAHLRLLGALNKLKEDIQSQEDGVAATNKELGWIVFVNRSVYRFFAWVGATWDEASSPVSENFLPPFDVIMVWHTYLLNPRAFYEDSRRMSTPYCSNLIAMEELPLKLIASLIDPQTLDPLPPLEERRAQFEQITNLPYSMPIVTDRSDVLTLDCPFCVMSNQLVRWIDDDEKGFAQTNFTHICEHCGKSFTKSNIGVRRFCEEVTRRRTGERVFFPETLLNPVKGTIDETAATNIIPTMLRWLDMSFKVLRQIPDGSDPQTETTKLAEGLEYDHLQLCDALHRGFRPYVVPDRENPIPRLQRISVAYSHAGLASLDLVGAVLRQGSFIQKMVGLGWTRPGRFDRPKDSAPLVRSIARYHAFLDLMYMTSSLFLVPTLDIDLSWHTHQLKSSHYRDETLQFLKRFPNHDDSIDASHISKGYDRTAKAWKARFGVPYSVCGCVPDRDSQSILSRFVSRIASIGSSKSKLEPPPQLVNSRPDLVSTEEEGADSSHPSEHNLHFGDPSDVHTLYKASQREKKTAKCVVSAQKGAHRDPWRGLQAERNESRREIGHKEAFTDPHFGYGAYYSYWGVSAAIPIGEIYQSNRIDFMAVSPLEQLVAAQPDVELDVGLVDVAAADAAAGLAVEAPVLEMEVESVPAVAPAAGEEVAVGGAEEAGEEVVVEALVEGAEEAEAEEAAVAVVAEDVEEAAVVAVAVAEAVDHGPFDLFLSKETWIVFSM